MTNKAHTWVPSTLSHGNMQCKWCAITDLEAKAIDQLECKHYWLNWPHPDKPMPAYWMATNPETGEETKVYRSYEDYVND